MTEPLTPPDCDLTDFQFMPLDVARLRDSELASNETPEACWAAVLLWAASWHQIPAASIPAEDRWIAKAAGYAQRGKIAREWADVKPGAMRGFVECSDGRLYHPVVAEKAREAWQAKLRQRWASECARIKKHNERHEGANVAKPTFEEWIAGGRHVGQPLFVPGDKAAGPADITGDKASKRQGEGQGDSTSEPNGSAAAGAAASVDNSENEARRLIAEARRWLEANGLTAGQAKAFRNTVAKDYAAVAREAFAEAMKTAVPIGDAQALVLGIAKRMTGERKAPVTVPSNSAAETAAYLAAQSARGYDPIPAHVRALGSKPVSEAAA